MRLVKAMVDMGDRIKRMPPDYDNANLRGHYNGKVKFNANDNTGDNSRSTRDTLPSSGRDKLTGDTTE